ncbi:NADH-quinone oxidoreductase subunit NuoN [Thermaurantiacus sp.]
MSLAQSLAIGAPEVILAAGICVLLLLGAWRGDRALQGLSWGAVLLLAVAAVPVINQGREAASAWGGLYVADSFSRYLKLLVFAASAAAILVAGPFLRRAGTGRFEYPVLILLATLGMGIMVSARNLLSLYVGLELMSLSAYVLAAFHRDDARSSEAGLKYFALGALASGLLLYGVSLVYGFTGSTSFDAIRLALAPGAERNLGVLIGLVFILAALAFKVSAVPFHMWTPDVYEGAPTPVVTFFGTAPKVAATGLMLRVLFDPFGGMKGDWQQILIVISIGSMLLGAVAAIGQTNVKRLLAYSAITNIGFALIGLAAGTAAGISAVLLYLLAYIVMTLGAFVCLMMIVDGEGQQREALADLAGLAKVRPGLAAALAIFMFSLAGIPPLFGFMPKLAVLSAAVEANLWPLAVIGVLASVIAAFYYLRVVKVLYFDPPADLAIARLDEGVNPIVIGVTAAFVSPLGYLLLGPLMAFGAEAARALP